MRRRARAQSRHGGADVVGFENVEAVGGGGAARARDLTVPLDFLWILQALLDEHELRRKVLGRRGVILRRERGGFFLGVALDG